MKNKNVVIISVDAKKAFAKFQHLHDKHSPQINHGSSMLKVIKALCHNQQPNNTKESGVYFPINLEQSKDGEYPYLLLWFSIVSGMLARATRKNRYKWHQKYLYLHMTWYCIKRSQYIAPKNNIRTDKNNLVKSQDTISQYQNVALIYTIKDLDENAI